MNIENLAKELILKNMTPEQQKAVLESVRQSVAQAKEVQKKKIGENVNLVVQALKKIETEIQARYDAIGTTIENRVASIKDGKDGKDGRDGVNGRDGKAGRDGAKGDKGDAGLNGRDGVDGRDGVSVTDAKIDFDGSLVITLSSGQEINVGEVVSSDIAEKIKVINTMSTNAAIAVKEEGTTLTNGVKSINFVGTGITATTSGDDVTVTVASGSGTVTSVAATGGTGISVTGSPITTSGTLTITNTAPDQTVALTSGTGISTSGTYPNFTITNSGVTSAVAGTGISVSGATGAVTITNSAPDQTVALTAGTGINTSGTYPNFTITNSAPDQTVSLTASTGISTSGTYPNFTITNTAPDQTVALTGAGTTSISGTYPNFTITSNDQYSGTVTSITAGTGLTGGTITTSGTVALDTSGVTAASYTAANITVDAYGRVTSASNGTAGGLSISDDTTTNATRYLTFTSATTGTITSENVSSTKLTFNPSTGILAATGFSGAFNGTVGATTANTGAFTTLSATGVTTVQAGTAALPAITTSGDTNTGIFFPAADTIAFSEGGVEAMRINSSGNLGIGTTDNSLFNSVGGTTRLAVCGSSASTDILGNTGASISIINTDTTANNTAGLHFARADTDDTPNYAGASIVAQFPDTQVTSQYPKGLLSFLTSTSANNAPSEKMRIEANGDLKFNSGYGSVATAYGCRAWVNFNGTGTVAIRASGNVTSITDNGTGDYTLNFTTAMSDTNYICTGTSGVSNTAIQVVCPNFDVAAPTTSAMRIQIVNPSNVQDRPYNHIAVFR